MHKLDLHLLVDEVQIFASGAEGVGRSGPMYRAQVGEQRPQDATPPSADTT